MPAGGPWHIHHIWGQVVKATAVASEGTGGELLLQSVSGDLTPDPAPGVYPLIGSPAQMGANHGACCVPLNLWEVDWEAAGKATVRLSYRQQLAITTASEVAAGIIFGTARPEKRPLRFCDSVQASFAAATEQIIGTITLAEKATRIVGILADLNKGDTVTVAEEVLATIRLDSADIMLPPAQYPCCRAFDSADGTPAGESGIPQAQFIPVDIPVTGGARINIFATTSISVTGNADLAVYIAYE